MSASGTASELAPVPSALVLRRRGWSLVLPRRALLLLVPALVGTAGLWLVALLAGEMDLGLAELWGALLGRGERGARLVLLEVRLPRALAAWTAGAALGLSGAMLQAITRNRLASPDILGVNDGAVFAVMIVALFAADPTVGSWWVACAGALLAFVALLLLGRRIGAHGHRILVIGIGVAHLFRAVNELMLSRGHIQHASAVYVWSVGSFVGRGFDHALPALLGLLLCAPWAAAIKRRVDCFGFDEELAGSLGVPARSTKLQAVLLAVIAAGLGLSVGGPLAFVALVAPIAVARLAAGPGLAIVGTILFGGGLSLGGDLVGRLILAPIELPVGVVCRIAGGACLLALLLWPRRGA